ncbi:tetratricopeptide repeat protein [Mucilaginibacter sp.]|jgi:tetratricopeptide (TPR) repeat protein|uniref:tetratricopeptide repeat protein n=1 Tax=Mucilaginibacter sp. TaxID=1882438 RepID=UPI002BD8ADFB|nr:tetratricopeptide repeat protein [Mucilaginibacter sp.]HTI60471.1 tetratricopeptide repeat protein [Mucilaginibacter sp.]
MNLKQIVVIVAVVIITAYLYLQPVKGLIKHDAAKPERGAAAGSQPSIPKVTVEQVSEQAKAAIGAALAATINDLESQLKNASSDADKLNLQKKLAKQWDDDNQPAPSAFYYLEAARSEKTFDDWMNAGNHFNDASKLTQDTTVQPAFIANAIEAFENATKLKPDNLDAETGLGVAYANQALAGMMDATGGPPKGIMILLDVVKKDPGNYKANLNLGQLAVQSRQFDKAVTRFKTAIANASPKDNIVEPYFFLAESYKQLGMKKEAIEAYEKCKQMIPDPVIGQKIEQYIKELKN